MGKSFFKVAVTVFITVVFMSCNKGGPKEVARDWLTDFYHLDYDAAKKISTDETKAMLNIIQGFSSCLVDSVKDKAKKVTITIKEVKDDGDKAYVTFTASNDPTHPEPPLKLVKQNDKWLVQFTKADFKPMEDKEGGALVTPDISITPAAPPAADTAAAVDTTKQ